MVSVQSIKFILYVYVLINPDLFVCIMFLFAAKLAAPNIHCDYENIPLKLSLFWHFFILCGPLS